MINQIKNEITRRLENMHIKKFGNKELLLISSQYAGLWLEHVYDADKNGNKRKYISSTIFHLFLEKVLDREEDKELIEKIYIRHIKNDKEFWTNYPFPSMAICDKSCESHADFNCWGYYTQGLIVLRCIRWMDYYNMCKDFDYICEKWLEAWTSCFDYFKFGQEIDPITGEPTKSSEWYSSCMLMYLYAAKRLGK